MSRLIALWALAGACVFAGSTHPPDAAVAIYYSFDNPQSAAAQGQMQAEMARVLEPTGIAVKWRDLGTREPEEFTEIVVIRFHGTCSPASNRVRLPGGGLPGGGSPAERELAGAKISEGRVLPFADVNCDLLRRYIGAAPAAGNEADALMGRAMARVVAHEMYHMLTGSSSHARTGIARAEHSRDELAAASFLFGKTETEWLRSWAMAKKTMSKKPAADAQVPDTPDTDGSDAVSEYVR